MSSPGEPLPALDRHVAEPMANEINLLYASAYADAALHDPNPEGKRLGRERQDTVNDRLSYPNARIEALEDCAAFVTGEFDGTDNELLLKRAFNNLTGLVRARASATPADALEYAARALEDRNAIAGCVRQETLPPESLEAFNAAYVIATAKTPRKTWVEIAENRKSQEQKPEGPEL